MLRSAVVALLEDDKGSIVFLFLDADVRHSMAAIKAAILNHI